MLAAAFFRADFDQTLGEKDEAGHLHPFGDDVADYLPPFAPFIEIASDLNK